MCSCCTAVDGVHAAVAGALSLCVFHTKQKKNTHTQCRYGSLEGVYYRRVHYGVRVRVRAQLGILARRHEPTAASRRFRSHTSCRSKPPNAARFPRTSDFRTVTHREHPNAAQSNPRQFGFPHRIPPRTPNFHKMRRNYRRFRFTHLVPPHPRAFVPPCR